MCIAAFVLMLIAGSSRVQGDDPSPPQPKTEARSSQIDPTASPSESGVADATHETLPAEESRLDTAVFRASLKRLGLIDVLDLHLRDFPPSSEVARWLMARDIKRAEFADRTRPRAQRFESIAEANQILERVIAEHGDDPRVLEWQLGLVRSLLYEEAEETVSRALFREEPVRDRDALASVTGRALIAAEQLGRGIQAEYQRIDQLSPAEFEVLERKGYVDELDRLEPQAEYIRLWALFYDSFWRDDGDATKAEHLQAVIAGFRENPAWLTTPHERSRVQVQALLLAGMTARRLNDHAAAREHLDRAITVAAAISDDAERQRILWAVSLAWTERARDERDQGRLGDALHTVDRFRKLLAGTDGDSFSGRVTAALTERSIQKAKANNEEKAGRTSEAGAARTAAWRALYELVAAEPARRDEIYLVLYELIGPDAAPTTVDPLERSAMIAGCLTEAIRHPERAEERLRRAIAWGEPILTAPAITDDKEGTLVAEALYNVGVAHYRLGEPMEAAKLFFRVARDYPRFDQSFRALTLAVQLAAEAGKRTSGENEPEVRTLYRESLELLVRRYPGTPEEGYWRFFYAQLLDEMGETEPAAAQFALVDPTHDLYVEGLFLRLRGLGGMLKKQIAQPSVDSFAALQKANEIVAVQRDLASLIKQQLPTEPDAERAGRLREMLAEGRVLTSEVLLLAAPDRAKEALEGVAGIETGFTPPAGLLRRVWRVRLRAMERLGQDDEIGKSVTAFLEADPAGAAGTLQELYEELSLESQKIAASGDRAVARRKAEAAWIIARQINEWTNRDASDASTEQRRAAALQWAEANLHSERFEEARKLFEGMSPPTGKLGARVTGRDQLDVRARFGLAEAMFQLGDFAGALPLSNRLAGDLPPSNAVRWHALLRDLQCRTTLGEPSADIIKVIQQQRYLYPDFGGPTWSAEFEKLQRENERRAGGP